MSKFSENEKVQILRDLVEIKSVNDNELEVCNYLHQLFSRYGIKSEIIKINDTRANLVAEIGSGSPVLGVSGHMDVVSALTAKRHIVLCLIGASMPFLH